MVQVVSKPSEDDVSSADDSEPTLPSHGHKSDNGVDESGQASVYVYKRENENAADILQPLISQDPRQFRLSGHRMQEVMMMDRTLNEHGRAEIITDSYRYGRDVVNIIMSVSRRLTHFCVSSIRVCVRRAMRWAGMGFTVSVGPPSGGSGEPSGSVIDKKKAEAEAAAKKKNLELLKSDPPRPFVSGHVAYSLASEVIGLLHCLLTAPGAAEVWSNAIKEVHRQSWVAVDGSGDVSSSLSRCSRAFSRYQRSPQN